MGSEFEPLYEPFFILLRILHYTIWTLSQKKQVINDIFRDLMKWVTMTQKICTGTTVCYFLYHCQLDCHRFHILYRPFDRPMILKRAFNKNFVPNPVFFWVITTRQILPASFQWKGPYLLLFCLWFSKVTSGDQIGWKYQKKMHLVLIFCDTPTDFPPPLLTELLLFWSHSNIFQLVSVCSNRKVFINFLFVHCFCRKRQKIGICFNLQQYSNSKFSMVFYWKIST